MSLFAAVLAETERLVQAKLEEEPTGHDWWHADRVRTTAVRIAEMEGADVLVHDVDDYKFSGDEEAGPRFARKYLLSAGVGESDAEHVAGIIRG